MKQYIDLVDNILEYGKPKGDRTGTGTLSLFGAQMRFDLEKGFPLLTTKKLHIRSILHELLFFIKADTNIQYLIDNNVSIWDEWASPTGEIGRIYGVQWRKWRDPNGNEIDQLQNVIDRIKTNPECRRLIITAWNPGEMKEMALPSCITQLQFYVNDNKLSCQMYQRSCDMGLGVPFDIASYSFLTHMIANVTGLGVGELIWTGGDVHIYNNHIQQLTEQSKRCQRSLPQLKLNSRSNINDFVFNDFEIIGYDPHPSIKMEVSV